MPLFGGSKSSIQLAVERLMRLVPASQILIGTRRTYADLLREQLPALPEQNYILEPTRRDIAAAVALSFFTLEKDGVRGPVIFQWSDHYVGESEKLLELFRAGEEMITSHQAGLVIIAQEPNFANDNLGWLKLERRAGVTRGVEFHAFGEWQYRPTIERCEQMFESREWVWNTGHFVTSVEFMTAAFRQRAPGLSSMVERIVSYRGSRDEHSKLEELYPQLEKTSFDDAILRQIPRDQAYVLKADLGWVDPGNLNSLKEAMQTSPNQTVVAPESVRRGDRDEKAKVVFKNTSDSLIYNETDRPVVVMGVSNLIVVEMSDVTLVIDKSAVRDMSALLEELKAMDIKSGDPFDFEALL